MASLGRPPFVLSLLILGLPLVGGLMGFISMILQLGGQRQWHPGLLWDGLAAEWKALLALAAVVLVGVAVIVMYVAHFGREFARVRLNAGLCASCSYPIISESTGPDDCRVCPECGAAWRLEA
jgi:hypothetical protein